MKHMPSGNTIRRTSFAEVTEDVTFEEFLTMIVQDSDVAFEIAFAMIEGDGTYEYGEDPESRWFERFEIIDKEGLYDQMNKTAAMVEGGDL